MNDIKIFKNEDLNATQAVSARELYKRLTDDINYKHFNEWVKRNILDNNFADKNVDYLTTPMAGGTPSGGRLSIDYVLTIDFAKELCMMSKCENGKKIRKYFIQCEKELHSAPSYMIEDPIARARAWADEQEQARLALAKVEEEKQILIEENTELKEDNDHCRAIHNLKDEWGYSRIEICKNFLEDKIKHPTFTAMLIEDNVLLDKDTINPLYIENGFMFKHLEKWSNNKGTSYVIKFTANGKYSLEPYFISCVESGKAFDEVLNYDKKVTKIKKAINTKPSKNKRTIKEREEKLKAAKINLDNALDLYKTTIYNRQNILKDIIEDTVINNEVK